MWRDDDRSWYDEASICLNGHLVSEFSVSQPETVVPFCAKCGAAVIRQCDGCQRPIRGYEHIPGAIGSFGAFSAPAHCSNCGRPYPWTRKGIEAARDLIDELDELDDRERDKLKASLDDLVVDTPASQVAVVRVKKALAKAPGATASALAAVIKEIATEAVRRAVFGPG